jgi:hypothetical protein
MYLVDVLDNLAAWLIRWRPHGALVLKCLECEYGILRVFADALGSHGVHDSVFSDVLHIFR